MQIPLEVNYRGVERTPSMDEFIRHRVEKLHRFAHDIVRCRVAVEKRNEHQSTGNPYRVRIEVTVPPEHDLVVVKRPGNHEIHDEMHAVVRSAFEAMERRVKDTVERRRGETKVHPEPTALVAKLYPGEGYGFLATPDGREIYFHRNSVLEDGFERLAPGTGVRFAEEMGEEGPQATSVRIVDKPGEREPGNVLQSPPLH